MRRARLVSLTSTLTLLGALGPAATALGDPCGTVELRFRPAAPNLQIVAWIEDPSGKVLDTPYITRVTGQFGLGNRPGAALLKTDFRWPYSRREMVFPVWAHRRDHHYPKIVMGGACGNSPQGTCPTGPLCGGNCADDTIAYHEAVSSGEPFYCSPSGSPDAVSCASRFTGSKGAYADAPAFSLYPPRADLTSYNPAKDSADVLDFAKQNDLVAVSAATPAAGQDVSAFWYADGSPAGDYVAFVELSQEADFTPGHSRDNPDHPNQHDGESAWDFEGHNFLGQPSVIYQVPFHCGSGQAAYIASRYSGYSTWDGSDGVLHAPDATIVDQPGSGEGRLASVDDGTDAYRVKVAVGGTSSCAAPAAVTELTLDATQTSIAVSFRQPTGDSQPSRFAVRYREGVQPITDDMFDQQVAAPSVPAGQPGDTIQASVDGLLRLTQYTVAVRAIAPCGKPGPVVSASIETQAPKFVTLHGCFVATAAWGSEMAGDVPILRAWRDSRLLTNPAGRLFTAVYYALSPPLANAIATDDTLRALARAALRPLVAFVTH